MMKISADCLHTLLGLPDSAKLEAAPTNDGHIQVMVTHDSIPTNAIEVTGRLGHDHFMGVRYTVWQGFEPVLSYPTPLGVTAPTPTPAFA